MQRTTLLTAATVVAMTLGLAAAQATPVTIGTLTVAATSAAGATAAPFVLDNPGTPTTQVSSVAIGNGATVTFNNTQRPYSGIYFGNTPNVAASPFSGTNLTPTSYFVAEPDNTVTIRLPSTKTFDLLWGSVDAYNYLKVGFYSHGSLIDTDTISGSTDTTSGSTVTISGNTVASAIGSQFPVNGSASAFVELSDTHAFDEIVITTGQAAFEFVPQVVPEPISVAILGGGLLALGAVRRRRQSSMTGSQLQSLG